MSESKKQTETTCPHCSSSAPEEVAENLSATEETGTAAECGCRHKQRSEEEYIHLVHRLNRIEGQLRGIRKMVDNDVYCTDILVQCAAAKSALNGFTRELVEQHLGTCVAEDLKEGSDEKLKEFMWILNKLV